MAKVIDEDTQASSAELTVFVTEQNRTRLMAIYDERMTHWPVPYETFFVDTRYGKTQVTASGDRGSPPLVMTHPMGIGAFVWCSIVAPLSEHRRVYALDTIGDVNKSELADADRYPKKGSDYSAWLDDVFAALDLTSADMVGGSMGGWIAMSHAISAPQAVDKLVLLGPMGLPPWRATLAVLGPFMSQQLRPSDAKLERIITRSLGEGERVNAEFRDWMRIMGYTKARVGFPFHIPGRQLRQISAPTLVFLGGKDGLVGDANAAAHRARRFIRGCKIDALPEAGHIMSVDEPDHVADRIIKFLATDARQPIGPEGDHATEETNVTNSPSPFRSAKGEARYLAAYEKSMQRWPIPYEPVDVATRFGRTHLNVSGPADAPPLLLVHGSFCSSTMWSPNIADLAEDHRVYAVDVIDQGGRSVPTRPMKDRHDCVVWMGDVLDALELAKVDVVAMSYGCWLSTNYAIVNPMRIDRLALISPGDTFVPTVTKFYVRGLPSMALPFLPRAVLRRLFMDWLAYADNLHDPATRQMFDLMTDQMYELFRTWRPKYTIGVATQGRPKVFPDDELRQLHVPTLLLIGEEEVVVDPSASLERAKRLIPNFVGELVPRASHDLSFSRHEFVDRRITEFWKTTVSA